MLSLGQILQRSESFPDTNETGNEIPNFGDNSGDLPNPPQQLETPDFNDLPSFPSASASMVHPVGQGQYPEATNYALGTGSGNRSQTLSFYKTPSTSGLDLEEFSSPKMAGGGTNAMDQGQLAGRSNFTAPPSVERKGVGSNLQRGDNKRKDSSQEHINPKARHGGRQRVDTSDRKGRPEYAKSNSQQANERQLRQEGQESDPIMIDDSEPEELKGFQTAEGSYNYSATRTPASNAAPVRQRKGNRFPQAICNDSDPFVAAKMLDKDYKFTCYPAPTERESLYDFLISRPTPVPMPAVGDGRKSIAAQVSSFQKELKRSIEVANVIRAANEDLVRERTKLKSI